MHVLKLKKFDILLNDDKNNIIAIQNGKGHGSTLDDALVKHLELKLTDFILNFERIVNITPNSTILDVGAGNSLADIALAKNYPDSNLKFILVDSNVVDLTNQMSSVYSYDYQLYTNNWALVFDNISANGLDPSNFRTVNPLEEIWAEKDSVDVVFSTASWGWHYPISTYIDRVFRLLKPGGYLIIRPLLNADNNVEIINELFGKPLYLNEYKYDQLKGIINETELCEWAKHVNPNNLDHVMFYHGYWQKPTA